jgi:2-succinyl-6-hydroxy-2,4-cyclohexadiene-1-carboxylate synthase
MTQHSNEPMPSNNILGIQHTYELTHPVESSPVLVFVHGWLLSRHYWKPLIQPLSSSYQCLTYDLRGFGESVIDTVQGQYTPESYAQDLILLLKQLNISRVWVIGHSLGGSIALWTAALAPQVVEGVVCLNSGGGIYLQEAFDRFRNAGKQMLRFRPSWLPLVPGVNFAFRYVMVSEPLPQQWGKQRAIDFVAAHPEAALRSLLDSTVPEQVHLLPQVVAKLNQPTYFLAGREDPVMELKYVYHLASFHKMFHDGQKNVIEIPNCGHMGMLEQTDAIAKEIRHCLTISYVQASS